MARMVLLLHENPDGSSHYDWLIERPIPYDASVGEDPNERCLISFRVVERLDNPVCKHFAADRLKDHRRLYLSFQGSLTGGRGTVRRLVGGLVRKVDELDGSSISIRGKFTGRDEFVWAGVKQGDLWQFQRSEPIVLNRKPERSVDDGGDIGYGVIGLRGISGLPGL